GSFYMVTSQVPS
ncbi:hypothetical protein ACN38_g10805, partial [Penicillium nordicum]